jgi:phage/plasmid-like protein (TIGR03299 family)
MTLECHMIDMSNGRANIAYAGATPWHGLGAKLEPSESVDVWCKAAGLDFTVAKAPLFAAIPTGSPDAGDKIDLLAGVEMSRYANKLAMYRTDTKALLGLASESHHKTVQPREIVEFYRDLVAELGMKLEVAGSLRGGARVWALARNGKSMRIRGQDEVLPYVLAATAFDGVRSTEFCFTTVRVVCNNTLRMVYNEMDSKDVGEFESETSNGSKAKSVSRIAVPHSQSVNWDAVKASLGLWTKAAEQFEESAQRLAVRPVTVAEASEFVATLFAAYKDDGKTLTTQSKNTIAAVVAAYKQGPGSNLRSADGTAWGLVNAVTYHVDHAGRARNADNRLDSAWFGAGDAKKSAALKLAEEMLLAA